ncbi:MULTISPECIES: helix-turn-helix domain-containing protein [Comamonas]|jgi:transcriptional regulator with XRE-family HTH domain|uniref:XRE family transcriptional regulator n=1 Tax=Comamonas terrigena TaxID=32013 RepID=A0A2A7UZE8_COMTR|nr:MULTISPECIES: helix-turn-helix transcriptional regulator [Comamonas]MBD9531904.1 helix-turn-helix transcriptional regulator [Comamonas sp. CMM01]MBV7419768.1 helix-turn-helix domain-containing protein [Comamonas sp. CMM03]MDH0047649.1 helix-turn-helix domain-containing protein [Comamonas terrigena]MDH0510069.1 helix-turn-helix domain-containing protein [Comamonas terrigena]MDH1089553.1 helix-turn-helix domain-containing protein [Comamonas terrigena]
MPAQHLVQDFGLAVRQLREGHGWSQEHLAAQSDLNRSYVGEIERGQVAPSLITLHKLAQALHLGTADLLAHAERIRLQRESQRQHLATRLAAIAG